MSYILQNRPTITMEFMNNTDYRQYLQKMYLGIDSKRLDSLQTNRYKV